MLTRSSAGRGGKSEGQLPRAPLQESVKSSNVTLTAGFPVLSTDLTVLLSPVKASSPRKVVGSPARRVPRAIHSPARRSTGTSREAPGIAPDNSMQARQTETCLKQFVMESPVRKGRSTQLPAPISVADRDSNPIPKHIEAPLTLSTAALAGGPGRGRGSSDRPSSSKSYSDMPEPRSSPLKRPARRMQDTSRPTSQQANDPAKTQIESTVSTNVSPLKKPPARGIRQTPKSVTKHTNSQIPNLSTSIDELSLPAKNARVIPAGAVLDKTPPRKRTPKRTAKSGTVRPIDQGQDEIAAQSYTPIRMPAEMRFAYSPPTEENEDDDLWTPSVPLSLTNSFAHMTLKPTKRRSASPSPASQNTHIFFDQEGNQSGEEDSETGVHQSPNVQADEEVSSKQDSSAAEILVYVDCKSSDVLDQSQHFSKILTDLGAKTLQRWNWNPETQTTPSKRTKVGVTHVVFFKGTARTLKKVKAARDLGFPIKCIGLSWVMQCKTSQRLTVGTDGHEVDLDVELKNLSLTRRKSMEPTKLTTPTKEARLEPASGVESDSQEYLAPVKFADDENNIFTNENSKREVPPLPPVAPFNFVKPTLSEFESKQLSLVRRNSAKFKPPVSSPLSKKAWRA